MVVGTVLFGLGVALLLLNLQQVSPQSPLVDALDLAGGRFALRAIFLLVFGVLLLYLAVFRLNRTLLAPYLRSGKPVVDAVAAHRRLGRGAKVVAIGGGTGLSTLLRGMKHRTSNLTAIVTVADDGGSSGRLRRSLGLPPPGDIRNCLAALSEDEDLLTQLFRYRFSGDGALEGHSFGNLFIAAIAAVTGSFEQGVLEAGRVLAVRGRVLPSTLRDVSLVADKAHAVDAQAFRIEGESRIPAVPGLVRRVHLEPNDVPAYPEAIRAILAADMIIIGPGSLYTSLLPNLLVPEITEAILASRAFKVFVCNVATQAGETDGYDCGGHLRAIEEHTGGQLVDLVLVNSTPLPQLPPGVSAVRQSGNGLGVVVAAEDVADAETPGRHDPDKLADVLLRLLEERTGPLDLPQAEPPTNGDRLN
jgi:uncharacterized cofD-like protein